MQSRNKFFEDMSQLMTNAMGVAQGAAFHTRRGRGLHLGRAGFPSWSVQGLYRWALHYYSFFYSSFFYYSFVSF